MTVPDQPSSSEALFTVLSLRIQLLPLARKKLFHFVAGMRTKIRNVMFYNSYKLELRNCIRWEWQAGKRPKESSMKEKS